MLIFLDAIERLSICNIYWKPVHKCSSLLFSSMKLECFNQLYLHNHYLLYFYPAFITSLIVFIVMNIIVIIITIISMSKQMVTSEIRE